MAEQPVLSVYIDANGTLRARDSAGNQVLSRARRGEPASLDEAVAMLTGAHRPPPPDNPPPRDDGGRFSGRKTVTRKDFEAMDVRDRYTAMRDRTITVID